MPIISQSDYKAPWIFNNPHLNTMYPPLFRQIKDVQYCRERISTPDHDFMDLDFSKINSSKLVIAVHGLESSSHEKYVKGIITTFNEQGWDGVAINLRGCSGETNNLARSYHSGVSEDLETIIEYIIKHKNYRQIALIGFSLGGNLVLKYLGERKHNLPSELQSAAVLSVPCCLKSCSLRLAEQSNYVYMQVFLNKLKQKMKIKAQKFPEINCEKLKDLKNFYDFDNFYTAPFHGFKDAEDYWQKCSSKSFVSDIKLPTLLINALDDPFLDEECFPFVAAKQSKYLYLETPKQGGHLGFMSFNKNYWPENKIFNFIQGQ